MMGNRPDLDEAIQHAIQGLPEEGLQMKLSLHFACANLKNMDIGSLTDSVVVVYMKKK